MLGKTRCLVRLARSQSSDIDRSSRISVGTASDASERRVVARADWTAGEANPRFVVTSLTPEEHEARQSMKRLYCARGEVEN